MKKFRVGEIYKSTNKITGDAYIGKTIRSRAVRQAEHILAAAAGVSGHFYNAIRKYGPKNFRWCTLKRVTEPSLNAAEIHFIAKHSTYGSGYNMTRGGDGNSGDPAICRKISKSLRKLFKEHPEFLTAMSSRALAFYATPAGEQCAERIAKSLIGFKHGKRARRNMSASLAHRYEDAAERVKTSKAGKRYNRSAAGKLTNKKKSAAMLAIVAERGGKYHSDATRLLLSEKAKIQWATKRDVMMAAANSWDHTPTERTKKHISKTLKKTYKEHPELMIAQVKKMTGRKASEETKAAQSRGIKAAWDTKSETERAEIGRRRSLGVTRHYDLIGRKPERVYKRSLEVRANMAAGALKWRLTA